MQRWTFHDPSGVLTDWTVPVNPTDMGAPLPGLVLTAAGGPSRPAALAGVKAPAQMQFTGTLFTQQHYESFVTWLSLGGRLHVTDHLQRTFAVELVSFEPTWVNSPAYPWKHTYSVRCTVYGEV